MAHSSAPQRMDETAVQAKLESLAEEIAADLGQLEAARSKQLLSGFVSDLFLSLAKQEQREVRRQRQAEGIAAAKARGVRFGRQAPPLPEAFEDCHRAWRNGELSLRQAAEACGMPQSSFYTVAVRREQTAGCAG